MPDYDAKNIPVLDDVIENVDDKKRDIDLSIESPDDETKENNLDLFTGESFDLAAEDTDIESATTETSIIEDVETAAEPQIGPVDNITNEDSYEVPLYSPEKAPEDEAEKFESALIDYTAADQTETPTIDAPVIEKPTEDQPAEIIQQAATTHSLQSLTDGIVKQLMPELEQQLRLLLEQALKEKLPEDIKQTEIPSTSNPDNY